MPALSLRFYRVSLNVPEMPGHAQALLGSATSPEALAQSLGWEGTVDPAYLQSAFAPHKQARDFLDLWKLHHRQRRMRTERITRGYPDLIAPRTGIKGWFQKRRDKRELTLPITADLTDWLLNCPRYTLLNSLHDALLGPSSVAEPREIKFDEIAALPHPVIDMITGSDEKAVKAMVEALSAPLTKIDPSFLIEKLAGYVHYLPKRGFAYYYA